MSVNSSISHPRLTRGSYTSYFTLQISNTKSICKYRSRSTKHNRQHHYNTGWVHIMCHLSLLLTTRSRRRCARTNYRQTSERRVRNSLVQFYERTAVSHSYHRDDGHGIAGNVQYSDNCCVARRRLLVCDRSLFTPRAWSRSLELVSSPSLKC